MTDIENEKIMPSIKGNVQREVMNDLLKLLDLVQKHADILQSGCLELLTLEYQKRCPLTAKINNMISLGIHSYHFPDGLTIAYFFRENVQYMSSTGASEYLL